MKQRTDRQKQIIIVWLALAILIASWLCPPWFYLDSSWAMGKIYHRTGFRFLSEDRGEKIDWLRLILIDSVVVAIAGGLLFTFRSGKDTTRNEVR